MPGGDPMNPEEGRCAFIAHVARVHVCRGVQLFGTGYRRVFRCFIGVH